MIANTTKTLDFLATLIKRGISPVDVPAVVVNGSGHGAPFGPMYSPECYCGRRLAGLETGPIPNRGPEVSAGLWVLISISGLFLALRVYLKMYRLKGLWWDDYILACAWVTLTLSGILDQVSISLFGLGHYPCDIPSPANNIPRLTLVGDHFGAMFSMFAVAISKSSWAVTLLRLFQRGGSTTTTSSSTGWPDQRQFNICIVWFVIITTCLVKGAQGILVWIPKCGSPAALGNPDMMMMMMMMMMNFSTTFYQY
ncbi:hypothetical protein QBC32DRAFT_272122 [Pseudoneurospora amorphoporcata]|uniref:Integral membrane protein n=1 Tax=Pseudoneurospora amorphoporcata TaxID=241081 RepID=A0AAN6NK07_9PEZI|nr:hypothetical protein QBC32DRAFT_272122 [Pseudoneurospora amorphoporcata]